MVIQLFKPYKSFEQKLHSRILSSDVARRTLRARVRMIDGNVIVRVYDSDDIVIIVK